MRRKSLGLTIGIIVIIGIVIGALYLRFFNWKEYVDANNKFRLQYPSIDKVEVFSDGTIRFSSLELGSIDFEIKNNKFNLNNDTDKIANQFGYPLKKEGGFAPLAEKSNLSINGLKMSVYKINCNINWVGGKCFSTILVILNKDGSQYIIEFLKADKLDSRRLRILSSLTTIK